MDKLLLVALGGAVGSVGRYLTGVQVGRWVGPRTPWAGTLTVNIAGGLIMGLLIGYLAFRGAAGQERWRLLLAVGVLGGFTTFSAFSLDAALLIQKRAFGEAGLYVVASVAGAILAVFAGLMMARRVFA